jgi:hypothetical protein
MARYDPASCGTVPTTQPSEGDTNVTASGAKPGGTGVFAPPPLPIAPVVVDAVAPVVVDAVAPVFGVATVVVVFGDRTGRLVRAEVAEAPMPALLLWL